MRNKALASAMTLAVMAAALPLRAAEQPPADSPLKAGDRIRIWASTIPKKTVGQVVEAGPDLLKIRLPDHPDPIEVPIASVTRLQRSLGRHSTIGKGALRGALIGVGAGVGVLLIAGALGDGCAGGCDEAAGPWIALFGTVAGAAGALVGAGVGAVHKTERWETLPVGRVGVSIVPQRRGAAVALSVRF